MVRNPPTKKSLNGLSIKFYYSFQDLEEVGTHFQINLLLENNV